MTSFIRIPLIAKFLTKYHNNSYIDHNYIILYIFESTSKFFSLQKEKKRIALNYLNLTKKKIRKMREKSKFLRAFLLPTWESRNQMHRKNYDSHTRRRDDVCNFFRSSPRELMILFHVPSRWTLSTFFYLFSLISVRESIYIYNAQRGSAFEKRLFLLPRLSFHVLFIVSRSAEPLLYGSARDFPGLWCNESGRHHRPRILSHSGTHASFARSRARVESAAHRKTRPRARF